MKQKKVIEQVRAHLKTILQLSNHYGVRNVRLFGAAILFFILLNVPVLAESYFSILAGPSLSFSQDIKYKKFDGNRKLIDRKLVDSQTLLRFKMAVKYTLFFHKNFGVESEFFYGQDIAAIDINEDKVIETPIKQNRYALLLSFLVRGTPKYLRNCSVYFGCGAGGMYSDFDLVGNGWGYGGQFFTGIDFPLSKKVNLFVETAYIWAPDVNDFGGSPGNHYKTSGNPRYNLATRIFGPHNDTQIISFMVGTRFKLTK